MKNRVSCRKMIAALIVLAMLVLSGCANLNVNGMNSGDPAATLEENGSSNGLIQWCKENPVPCTIGGVVLGAGIVWGVSELTDGDDDGGPGGDGGGDEQFLIYYPTHRPGVSSNCPNCPESSLSLMT